MNIFDKTILQVAQEKHKTAVRFASRLMDRIMNTILVPEYQIVFEFQGKEYAVGCPPLASTQPGPSDIVVEQRIADLNDPNITHQLWQIVTYVESTQMQPRVRFVNRSGQYVSSKDSCRDTYITPDDGTTDQSLWLIVGGYQGKCRIYSAIDRSLMWHVENQVMRLEPEAHESRFTLIHMH